VVLTGAGISAESGIRTFRDSGGLWESHQIEDVATPEGFDRNPNMVIEFYNQRRQQLKDAQPNEAHLALASLEERLGNRMLVVTQNVDDLHDRAGSKNLIHMHGELKKLRCLRDESHVIPFETSQDVQTRCPYCHAEMRPHIVWFGEVPFQMEEIQQALLGCTHFVYIGTSSQVYPAAGFRHVAKHVGAKVLCINLEVEHDHSTDYYLEGTATSQMPIFLEAFP
jgi:NAD-dependent deacetylase